MQKGKLFLIPTMLGETEPEKVIPSGTLEVIRELDIFIVEELRSARRFLKKAGYVRSFDTVEFLLLNEHTLQHDLVSILTPLLEGKNMGLLSEAGMPCVADPGSELVKLAHENGIRVIPLTGPSSLLLALAASGFNGQNFSFAGYLPVDKDQRKKKIREIERAVWEKDQTQIFIETPYRTGQMFQALTEVCRGETLLCMATDLTTDSERIIVRSISDWRKTMAEPGKKPCVFLLYR